MPVTQFLTFEKNFKQALSAYGLYGYTEANIEQFYHTHPGSSKHSLTDIEVSNNLLITFWVITPNGKTYVYSPLDESLNLIDLKYFLNF